MLWIPPGTLLLFLRKWYETALSVRKIKTTTHLAVTNSPFPWIFNFIHTVAFISIALISGFPVPEKTFVNEITAVFHSLRQVTAASLAGAEFPVSVSVQMPEQQQQQVVELLLEKVERIIAHVTFTQSVRLVSLLSYLILACYSAHTRIIEIWLYNCS